MININTNKLKRIAFDLDETLCFKTEKFTGIETYYSCEPIKKNIEKLNQLYANGKYIIIYTSRGMSLFNQDIKEIEKHLGPITRKNLRDWNVNYNELIFGKLEYDLLIDDKAINVKNLDNL